MQEGQDRNAQFERHRRENKNIFPPTFLRGFQKEYTHYAYDVVLKEYETATNHCKFDEEIYQSAVKDGLPFHPTREVVVFQEIQVQTEGETIPITI